MSDDHNVVLVTGTSSAQGLGLATARALAGAGHTVYGSVRDPARAAPQGPGIRPCVLDLLDRASICAVLEKIDAEAGRLDTIVCNAGYGVIGGVEQVSVDTARTSFETNVWGTTALVQEALPRLRARGGGHLILVSSCFVAGLPVIGMGYYLAAKAALETLFFSLAAEEARSGIRVSVFQPGPIMTDLERVWGDRVPPGGDPHPTLSDELYSWVQSAGPAPQQPVEAGVALAALVAAAEAPLVAQSGRESEAYAAGALRDPSRGVEFAALRTALAAGPEGEGN